MITTQRIRVKGKVQGVFYRVHTKREADMYDITGFVKNMPDGSVYIEASGSLEQLYELIKWCHIGPPEAEVSEVIVETIEYKEFESFEIER